MFALTKSKGVQVLDRATLLVASSLTSDHGPWTTLKVLEGRDEVAAGDEQGRVAIWNYQTGILRHVINSNAEKRAIRYLTYSAASGLLALAADNLQEVQIYDVETAELVSRLPSSSHAAIALSPDGRHIAIDAHHSVNLFDVWTQKLLHTFGVHSAGVNSICCSARMASCWRPATPIAPCGSGPRPANT